MQYKRIFLSLLVSTEAKPTTLLYKFLIKNYVDREMFGTLPSIIYVIGDVFKSESILWISLILPPL